MPILANLRPNMFFKCLSANFYELLSKQTESSYYQTFSIFQIKMWLLWSSSKQGRIQELLRGWGVRIFFNGRGVKNIFFNHFCHVRVPIFMSYEHLEGGEITIRHFKFFIWDSPPPTPLWIRSFFTEDISFFPGPPTARPIRSKLFHSSIVKKWYENPSSKKCLNFVKEVFYRLRWHKKDSGFED